MRVLIIGCGYVGLPLGVELLRQGHAVAGLRRSAEGAASVQRAGLQPLTADITRRGDLAKLPLPYDWIVNTISSGKGGAGEYQEVYLEGTRNLIEWLAPAPPGKFIHTGSTSVYGQTDASQAGYSWPPKTCCSTPRAPGNFPPSSCAWLESTVPGAAIISCNISRARRKCPAGASASST